ncbi:MAG: hypothetical protein WBA16_03230 [Nonlabens sp.]
MNKLWLVLLLLCSTFSIAQITDEIYPVFQECDDLDQIALQDCFYTNLYSKLLENYDQSASADPADAADAAVVSVRFEVDREGRFQIILLGGESESARDAVRNSFEQLPVVRPATYRGTPIYMQFVVNITTPLIEGGRFLRAVENQPKQPGTNSPVNPSVTENAVASDSIAFAKANQDFSTIISNQYDKHELRSNANIPFSYQRYHRYEAAMNKVGTNAHTAVKPYTFNYVNQYFDLEADRDALLKEKSSWVGRKWHNEHFFEVAGENYWFVVDPGVDLQIGRDVDNEITTWNNTRLVAVNGGIGKQITFGTTIHESQGKFPRYFQREIERRAPDGGNPGIVPGRGIAEDGGTDIFDYPLATGYINYKPSKYFDLQLGHGQHFIGDGHRSLVLSDNSQPFPYFKVNAKFWKLDYTVLYTSLRDVRPQVTANDSYRTKFMTHHYLSWNATKRLTVGLFESVLWQDDNQRGFDFNYINPVIFYQTIELQTGSRGGNALLGATAKYKFSDRVTAYGQLVIDEFAIGDVTAGEGSYRNKSGYQLGVKWQNAVNVKNLMLQAEYNRVRPYTYSHNDVVLNYGNSNQALAHPWGANFYEAILIGRYTRGRWYGMAKAIYGQRGFDRLTGGDNFFYGGNIYRTEDDRPGDLGNSLAQGNTADFFYGHLEAGYLINPASRLKVFGQLIYRNMEPQISNSRVEQDNTVWVNIGLRTDILNWSMDR